MYIFYSLDQKDLDIHLIKNASVSLSVMTLLKKKNQTSRGKKSHALRRQSSVSDNVVRVAKLHFLKISRLTILLVICFA